MNSRMIGGAIHQGRPDLCRNEIMSVRHTKSWHLEDGNPNEDAQSLEYTEIWSKDPGYHESTVKILRADAII